MPKVLLIGFPVFIYIILNTERFIVSAVSGVVHSFENLGAHSILYKIFTEISEIRKISAAKNSLRSQNLGGQQRAKISSANQELRKGIVKLTLLYKRHFQIKEQPMQSGLKFILYFVKVRSPRCLQNR